jgi:mono/diheme cytochrome c family protein
MIATYAFVAVWVSLGVGVLLTALLRKREPKTGPQSPSSRSKLAITMVLLYAGIGIAVPAVSIADSYNSDIVKGEGIQLTADQKKGQALFGQLCGSCHRLNSSNSQGRVGPNLDVQLTPQPAATPAEAKKNFQGRYDYVHTTIINGIARGNGNMPALIAQGTQADQIASFVAATAGYKNPDS